MSETGQAVGCGASSVMRITRGMVRRIQAVANGTAKAPRGRFPEAVRGLILKSGWWELPAGEVAAFMAEMTRPLGDEPWWHPLLAKCGNVPRAFDPQGTPAEELQR